MNKAFRRSLLSLTAASAMASSAYATGNAAYLDVKVNYLNPDGKVIVGEDEDTGDQRERVEILVSVLDANGEFASKDKDGNTLSAISIDRGTNAVDINDGGEDGSIVYLDATGAINGDQYRLSRELDNPNNISRFVLDYTDFTTDKLTDTLKVTGGDLEETITIDLTTVDAKGLVVRVTPNEELNTAASDDKIIGATFGNIQVTDDNNLDAQSNRAPGGRAGTTFPIRVYASSVESNATAGAVATNGKYTLAPNLEGKTIVVQAVGDYTLNGTASTKLGDPIEIEMSNGIATGEITINQGLAVDADNAAFGTVLDAGLGVAFIAYVKDDEDINNRDGLDIDTASTFSIVGSNADTDSIKVKSGDAVGLKVGVIDVNASASSSLWKSTSTDFYIIDANQSPHGWVAAAGDLSKTITMTVVDDMNNPASLESNVTKNYHRFDGYNNTDENSSRFLISDTNNSLSMTAGYTDNGDAAAAIAVIQSIIVEDNVDKNGTANETLRTSYANNALSAMEPVSVKLHAVAPLKSTKKGSPTLADLIDVNTTTVVPSLYGAITAGLKPDATSVTTGTATNSIQPEFSAKIKVADVNTSDNVMTLRIWVPDPEDAGEYITNSYYVDVDSPGSVAEGNTSTAGTSVNTTQTLANGGLFSYNSDGYYDINVSADANITFFRGGASNDNQVANLNISDSLDVTDSLDGNSITIDFKAYDKLRVPAYVEAYIETEEEPVSGTNTVDVGTVVHFKFSGDAASVGDSVRIDFNASAFSDNTNTDSTNSHPKVGLADGEYSSSLTDSVTATIPGNKVVSVRLYESASTSTNPSDTDNDLNDNNTSILKYGLESVTVNGFPVIYKTQANNGDTDEIYELTQTDLFTSQLRVKALDENSIAAVRIVTIGSTATGTGVGNDEDNLELLPTDVVTEIANEDGTNSAMSISKTIHTNNYYSFLNSDTDIILRDAYSNLINSGESTLDKNIILECSEGLTCNLDRTPANNYIFFKPESVGTTQTVTIKAADKPEIFNTVTFTNIKSNVQNTKFDIEANVAGKFNLVNSEIVIKISGNGNREQEETTLTVTSDNEDATLRLVPLVTNSNFFRSVIDEQGVSVVNVADSGTYYFLSSDKPGNVTINATATIAEDDSDTEQEEAVTGSASFEFVAVDLDLPFVDKADVNALTGSISVKVTDNNLDLDGTMVTVKDVNGVDKKVAEYTQDNTFVASGLAKGTYQVSIYAMDKAGNIQEFSFVREVTEGENALPVEDQVSNALAAKAYDVDGTFFYYDFEDSDAHLNWVYEEKASENVYRLKGDATADGEENPFGWSMVDVDTSSITGDKWYMIKLTGAAGAPDAAGKFGWVMVKSDLSVVKKIEGVKANGSFEYTQGLSLKATMGDDGKITFSR